MNSRHIAPLRTMLGQHRTLSAPRACGIPFFLFALVVLAASTAAQPTPRIQSLSQGDGGVIAIDVSGASSTD